MIISNLSLAFLIITNILCGFILGSSFRNITFYTISQKKTNYIDIVILVLIALFAVLTYVYASSNAESFTDDTEDVLDVTFTPPASSSTPPLTSQSTSSSPDASAEAILGKNKICDMITNSEGATECTYTSAANDNDKLKYLCTMNKNNKCTHMETCIKSKLNSSTCEVNPQIPSDQTKGKTCSLEQEPVCKLKNVEGFVGFPKLF